MVAVSPIVSDQWNGFEHIYRDASFVRWDSVTLEFFIDPTGEFGTLTSFIRICRAAHNEYGVSLCVTEETTFEGLPEVLCEQIRTLKFETDIL